jgi:arylsulfatase A-like enzyme
MSEQPNILLLLTDQQTQRAMSCAGNPWLRTPCMDRLAAEGVRFANSYCTSPVCGPSRASIATGLMPHQHGLVYNHDPRFRDDDATRLPTIADSLRAVGYDCHWVGKWHASEFYPNRSARIHAFDFLPVEGVGHCALGIDMDDRVTRRACEFLASAPREPWFLGVAWHNPHDICYWIVGDEKVRRSTEVVNGPMPTMPANFSISPDEPEFLDLARQRRSYGMEMRCTRAWDHLMWSRYLRAYYDLVQRVDEQLGLILKQLDDTGLQNETLVIFTSDHGEGCAGHRQVAKLAPYEEATAVPLIIRLPEKRSAGTICNTHIASGIDLFPTISDFAGSPTENLIGQSLRPLLEAPSRIGRDFAVVSVEPDPERPDLAARSLRTAQFRYMAFSQGEPREALYDTLSDPGETVNLVRQEDHQSLLLFHRHLLKEWCAKTADPFATYVPSALHGGS